MHYSPYKVPRNRRVNALAILFCVLLLPYQCDSYTEVFSITQDSDDNTYFVGNRDSDFFIGKKNSFCALQWESTAGSTSGDDNDDGNSEVFHDAIVGQDGAVYAVGSTHGSFSSPSNEVPNLDAAVVVYDSSSGNVIQQKQYDIAADLDNVAQAISQKANGNLLVAVYGSVPNIESIATYETRILEIDPETLEVQKVYEIVVTTTENVFSITGGPKLLDFIYEESTNSIIALGHILGRGLLWKYSFETETASNQVEWGEAFRNFQISAFTSDGNGAYYVVGSSSERVLENNDLQTTVSAEFHAYVIRFDNLDTSNVSPTWVRQLAGSGSSQSGSDVAIDPVTGGIVIVGEFDADFTVTDAQTAETFTLNISTDDGITDVFLWYLDASTGDFKELRSSSVASTNSEDRGNAVSILSRRTAHIGGITNDGDDSASTVCDMTNTLPSPTPSASPSPSVTPSSTPSTSSSPSSSPSPSQTVSLSMASSTSGTPTPTSTPSPSRFLLSPRPSTSPSSSSVSSAFAALAATSSPSPFTSRTSPTSSPSPTISQISASETPSSSLMSDPSETSEPSFGEEILPIASLDTFESPIDSSEAAVLASLSASAEASGMLVSSGSLSAPLEETANSEVFISPLVSVDPATEDAFDTNASIAPTADVINQEEPEVSSNAEPSSLMTMETPVIGTSEDVANAIDVSKPQEAHTSGDVTVFEIDETPSANERDTSVTETPDASSDTVLISFLSATPSPSPSSFASNSAVMSLPPILSQNLDIDEDPSVSISYSDSSPQPTPEAIPSMTFMFVSVDLGTPTPSPFPITSSTSASDSSLEAPSRTFDFTVVDLGVSFSPSTSSLANALDVNLISPTPTPSRTALLVNLGMLTPGSSPESSPVSENDGKAEASVAPELSSETLAMSSGPELSSSVETLAPDEDAQTTLNSIMPEPSELFFVDAAASTTETSPIILEASIDPSSTPQPMIIMSQTSGAEEHMMESELPLVESTVDEVEISPLPVQAGETAAMSPPEASMAMTPLVSEDVEVRRATSSPNGKDIDVTGEATITSDTVGMSRATPEYTDEALVAITGLAQLEMSASSTSFDVSTEPLYSPQASNPIVSSRDDDVDEKDLMGSAFPSSESRPDEVTETPLFTQTGDTGSVNSPEIVIAMTPVSESTGNLIVESPKLLGPNDEPNLMPSETFHASEETPSFIESITSSPGSETTTMDFLESPEPSRGMTGTLLPSDLSSTLDDDDGSFVTISPDGTGPQLIQTSGNTPEPSTLISSESITPDAVSTQAADEGLNVVTASTEIDLVQQTTDEMNIPNESMVPSSLTNPAGPLVSSSEAEEEKEVLQTSVEDEKRMEDASPTVTIHAFHTNEEDIFDSEPKQSLAPEATALTEPLSTLSPSVFATEQAGSSETPLSSSKTTEESEVQDVLASQSPEALFTSASITETHTDPMSSVDSKEDFESGPTISVSTSSEFTNPQGSAETRNSLTASSEEIQSTRIAEPEESIDSEEQMVSTTPESSAQVTAMAIISSPSETLTQVPSTSQTTISASTFLEAPSPSEEPELQQGPQSTVFQLSETSTLPSQQPLSASIETSLEFRPQETAVHGAFASNESPAEISATLGFEDMRGVLSQEPDEGPQVELSATPDVTTVSASQMQTPTPVSESLTRATMDASRTPDMAGFSPDLDASISAESSDAENSRSPTRSSPRAATPSVDESLLVSISASVASTPKPSKSITVETTTPTTTQGIPSEPAFSFIDIVFPSATPSSSPGTVTASLAADVATISASPDVSRTSSSPSPVLSQGIPPVSPSIAVGSMSFTPSVSTNPSEAVLIVLPSATPSSSLAVLIILPSATPSSSLAVKGSNTVKPSSTAIESQPEEFPFPVETLRFSSTPVKDPEESLALPSPLVSQSIGIQNPSPSSADRGFFTIAPSFQGFETPVTSTTPLPVESRISSFSQAPTTSSSSAPSSAEFSLVPSGGSPTFLPSRTSQASPIGTQRLVPSSSNQPSTSETPTETIPVSALPSSTAIPTQRLPSPNQPLLSETPTREPLESALPSSLESASLIPSISSLPSFVGNTNEVPSVSSQPIPQASSSSVSPSTSGSETGFTSQTFLLEPSAFQSVELSLLSSAEATFEEPTASLLPSQTESTPFSSEAAESAEVPTVTEEIRFQTPAISQDMDEREEEASSTAQVTPISSEEVEFSTVPSSLPSPSSALTASAQPTTSSGTDVSPTTSIPGSSSPSPTSACVGDESILVGEDSLNQTRNFQRVNMVIQVAGPNLTGACLFTGVIAERFILLSATNTLSQVDMWYITSIENGPPVFEEESTLVAIEDGNSIQGDATVVSPSPSSNATKGIRFEGSVIFNVTAFMDSLSVQLASGSYVEYINSQNIVKVMTAEGFDDIQWTGMISAPRVIDVQVQEEDARVGSGGLTSGEISAVAIGMLLIIGVAAFVIIEGGISTRGSGAILPI